MSTPVNVRETMSALADGELASARPDGGPGPALEQALDEALALWADEPEARQAWSAFHTAGDVLRSEELAAHAADDEAFLAALRGRLQAEGVEPAGPLGLVQPGGSPASPHAAPAHQAAAGAVVTPIGAARARRARWRPPVWMGSLAAVAGVGAVGIVLWVTQLQAPAGSELAQAQRGQGMAVATAPLTAAPPSPGPVPGAPVGGSLGLAGTQPVSVDAAPSGSGPARVRGGAAAGSPLEEYLRSHLGTALAPAPVKLESEGWTMRSLPAGYELQGAVRRLAGPAGPAGPGTPGGAPPQQLQAVYSDGTHRVSVFIEPLPAGLPPQAEAVQAGATLVLAGPHPDGAWVTLAGNVPLPTLQAFAAALQRRR